MVSWYDLTKKHFKTLESSNTISKIIPILKKEKEVLIVDNGKYKGIILRKDVLKQDLLLSETKISNYIYKPPILEKKHSNLDVAKFFIESGAIFLPVIESSKVESILYRIDFLNFIVCEDLKKVKVLDLMNINPKVISPDYNLAKVISVFQENNLSKLVVYDKKILGVITLSTILNYFMNTDKLTKTVLQNTLVKQVMKEPIIINKNASISELMDLFINKNVSSIIVANNNDLLGIVTKTNILEYYIYKNSKDSKNSVMQISAKFSGLDKKDIEDRFEALQKYIDKDSKIFVYFKLGKEKFRGLPLVNCRVRVLLPKKNFNVSVESWGIEHSIELAIQKLKRMMGNF